ncbi:CHAT domain-containing protein [Desulfobacula toluolica]|uniref:Tetratricopeptide repeat domain protein n=1 Tax=Desulfobacula toluolica (strain DSM 7467 / Tol2) TaxID=651182 RepID=K0N9Z8_DESTT|nr:CHAT domain-containing protein [Desulfobacula toluolica]CCK80839.1 tetratricopeptide repeat domain protein [Desulfobacula toluolica Tol2]
MNNDIKTLPLFQPKLILTLVIVFCLGNLLPGDRNVAWSAAEPIIVTSSADHRSSQSMEAFRRGNYKLAASHWMKAVSLYNASGMIDEKINALIQLANAYQVLGLHCRSLETLRRAEELTQEINDRARLAAILGSQGNAYFSIGAVKQAGRHLEDSIAMAREAGRPDIEAATLNNLGNLLTVQKEYGEALDEYDKCINLSKKTGNQLLATKALINAARAAVRWLNPKEMETYLEPALEQTRELEDSHDKAYGLVALGQIFHTIGSEFTHSPNLWRNRTYQALIEAVAIADTIGNPRVKSYALGYLGQLYEDEKRIDEALYLTRRAIFAAQQVSAPEILYLWQRQTGRLLRVKGDIDGAIATYRHAMKNLQTIRQDLSTTYQGSDISFRDRGGQIFLEMADLLLKRAETRTNPTAIQDDLKEVRDTIEHLRKAELCDYFQDPCITTLQEKKIQLERLEGIAGHTAVVYPIFFPDRLELLLNLPDETIKRFIVTTNRNELKKGTIIFRRALEKNWKEYKPYAQRLYNWLIRPLEGELTARRIDTLVFIPDDFLRTIPMAALHDGNRFLIGKYAVAIMPGRLTFIKPNLVKEEKARPLLTGLTKSVQNNPPLPKVAEELKTIQELYGGKKLLDENFNIKNLEQELKNIPYTIVHMATHGKFKDNISESYLWTYDGKLTMNDLETLVGLSRFRENPVDLLTLSACETAAGDDRAALGLAGVAVKAGACSALASLWFVGDEVAALLIPEFYRQLKAPGVSKAEALRQAQLKMLTHGVLSVSLREIYSRVCYQWFSIQHEVQHECCEP